MFSHSACSDQQSIMDAWVPAFFENQFLSVIMDLFDAHRPSIPLTSVVETTRGCYRSQELQSEAARIDLVPVDTHRRDRAAEECLYLPEVLQLEGNLPKHVELFALFGLRWFMLNFRETRGSSVWWCNKCVHPVGDHDAYKSAGVTVAGKLSSCASSPTSFMKVEDVWVKWEWVHCMHNWLSSDWASSINGLMTPWSYQY
jgi:hypothetical protein